MICFQCSSSLFSDPSLFQFNDTKTISQVILDMRTNAISWNPMEAFVFLAANEDYNVYSFDVR